MKVMQQFVVIYFHKIIFASMKLTSKAHLFSLDQCSCHKKTNVSH